MAIEKNYVKASASRFDSEFSVGSRSRESMSSGDDDEDDELRKRNAVRLYEEEVEVEEDDDDDEYDDADSGAGSDDFDLLELGETRSEFCQVGDQTCSIPFELYDLPDLRRVLSVDAWNDCLTDQERFSLTKYLPDMDQETFMRTLKDLFEGDNFHFGNPVTDLFRMLKGGLSEPRVSLYRQGLNFFQKHMHYHLLRKHQDSMVASLLQMREAWQNCKGYSIEEKLRVLNIVRSQKSLMGERNEDMVSDSSGMEESGEALCTNRSKGRGTWKKPSHDSLYGVNSSIDAALSTKYGKKNKKGLLKVVGSKNPSLNEITPPHQQAYQSMKYDPYVADSVPPRGGKVTSHDARQIREHMAGRDHDREMMYGMEAKRDWNVAHCNVMDRGRSAKSGKMHEVSRVGEYDGRSYSSFPFSAKNDIPGHGRNPNINQLSDIKVLTAKPSNIRALYDPAKKYVEPAYEDQMRLPKGRAKQMALKGNMSDFPAADELYWNKNSEGEVSFGYEGRDVSGRKLKIGREVPDSRLKALQNSQLQMDDRIFHPKKQAKLLSAARNGGSGMVPFNGGRLSRRGEDTESDSSDQLEEEDVRPLIMTKSGSNAHFQNFRSPAASVFHRKEKRAKKDVKGNALTHDEMLAVSNSMCDFERHVQKRHVQRPETETYSSSHRSKAKMRHSNILQSFTPRAPEDEYFSGSGNAIAENSRKSSHRLVSNVQLQAELAGSSSISMNKPSPVHRRQRVNVGLDFTSHRSKHVQDFIMEGDGGLFTTDPVGTCAGDSNTRVTAFASSAEKQKGNESSMEIDGQEGSDYKQSHQEPFESIPSRRRAKRKPEADSGSPDAGAEELPVAEVQMAEVELESKPQKKPFILITPTIHTDFSFSVIHLVSAVRMALITPNNVEEPLVVGNSGVKEGDENGNHEVMNGSVKQSDVKNDEQHDKPTFPSRTTEEIVNRVRSNPGDPCILETQESLEDLVRGVMKIFSSRTAPLGAKNWKPLVCFVKSTKSWTWIGPVPSSSTDLETLEELVSPEGWRIPHKMLVKIVDAFANWLKNGLETLRQIGTLPPPPMELMQLNFDEKERFKDLRAQKSLSTISKSSEEVRAYFQKEEQLRYSVPERAFSYTAADGKKSIVAPLRRCGGKPTSKARDHFMLKRDRPPHVTILCLVRDAAARLPGSIGTRADVCTLIRDSQYIVEDVSDTQVNQVVSGAMDRLHYERDPCVQYDNERKLWAYLHREREEEDFEDDGTSSTKKWKRQKKDASEPDDQVTVACHGSVDPNGFDISSDIHVEPSGIQNDKILEVENDETRQRPEDDEKASDIPEDNALQQMLESELHCQENSANEDFDYNT